ncbi:hypothetical protein [Noviherbaspirillum humi]|uniref:hypothetical protein n=1 Tax=Noviherbaspirillum humi TaxID=1688639 RepID=UPI0011601281|nr:hypothetical protein [Noviherbaspirillum humi]
MATGVNRNQEVAQLSTIKQSETPSLKLNGQNIVTMANVRNVLSAAQQGDKFVISQSGQKVDVQVAGNYTMACRIANRIIKADDKNDRLDLSDSVAFVVSLGNDKYAVVGPAKIGKLPGLVFPKKFNLNSADSTAAAKVAIGIANSFGYGGKELADFSDSQIGVLHTSGRYDPRNRTIGHF